MGLFRRRADQSPAAALDFWQWWAANRDEVTAAVDAGRAPDLADRLTDAVRRGIGDVEWEMGPARTKRHALVVSAAGDRVKRAATQQWWASAPDDPDWEFFPARQPEPDFGNLRLGIAGHDWELNDTRFDWAATDDGRLDVTVWHPRMADVPQQARHQVAFLALDWAIGEDMVEQWVAAIDADTVPDDAAGVDGLRAAIGGLAESTADNWVLLEGETEGHRLVAMARAPMPRLLHLDKPVHVQLQLQYGEERDDGLPGSDTLAAANALQDAAETAADLDAVLVAIETGNGVRTLHFYATHRDVAERLRPVAAGWTAGGWAVEAEDDPGWLAVDLLD